MHTNYVWLTKHFAIQKGGVVSANYNQCSTSVVIYDTHDNQHTIKDVSYDEFVKFMNELQGLEQVGKIEKPVLITSKKVAKKTTRRTNGKTKQDKRP